MTAYVNWGSMEGERQERKEIQLPGSFIGMRLADRIDVAAIRWSNGRMYGVRFISVKGMIIV